MILGRSLVVGVGVCVISGSVWAAERHVPSEYATIQSAIVAAEDGDEVIVAAGRYHELVDFLGKGITLRSASGPEATTIDGTDLGGSVVTIEDVGVKPARLEGFTITGGTGKLAPGGTQGGGVYIGYGGPVIADCIIEGNQASAGGGVSQNSGWALIVDTTFRNNIADGYGSYGGAGLRSSMSTLTMIACEFLDNRAVGAAKAGGAQLRQGTGTVVNCRFVRNEGGTGGALVGSGMQLKVINSTIAENYARSGGGAVMIDLPVSPSPRFTNCVFWGNEAGSGPGGLWVFNNPEMVVEYSLVEGGWSGVGEQNRTEDPLFVNPAGDDYCLSPGSPCIDAGLTEAVPEDVQHDLMGNDRVIGSSVDMGAVEAVDAGEPDGACCFADGACVEVSASECAAAGGEFQSDGLACAAAPCPQPQIDADFNQDGWVDAVDLFELLSAWGQSSTAHDLDQDGSVASGDLYMLLGLWGPQG
mgnify:CR=1 FL=1